MRRSRDKIERATYDKVKQNEEKWRKQREKARKMHQPLPQLDPKGLEVSTPSDRDSDAYRYWKALGGTPMALHPSLAPIPVSPDMRLWIRLDEDLIGGLDEAGCFHRSEAMAAILPDWESGLRTWFQAFCGYPSEMTQSEVFLLARQVLRQIGSGRAIARNEEYDEMGRDD